MIHKEDNNLDSIRPEGIRNIRGKYKGLSNLKKMSIFPLSNPILFKGAWISGLMDNTTLIKIRYKCRREILPTSVSMKDFYLFIKLGFNHCMK